MTGTWIGKTRSLGLWSTINEYVTRYATVNNIASDEPWLQRWNELITVHKITKKKRDFEFIAYVICGNPEATVNQCLQHLFTLIPFLEQHINITAINDNGNIQYTYTDEEILPLKTVPEQIGNDNLYTPLSNESDTAANSQAEKDLESILNSDNSTQTVHNTNQDVYTQALTSATSTLKKLSDYTDEKSSISNDVPDQTDTLSNTLKDISNDNILSFKLQLKELTSGNQDLLRHMQNEYYNKFCKQCDSHISHLTEKFRKDLQEELEDFEDELSTKLNSYKSKIVNLKLQTDTDNTSKTNYSKITTPTRVPSSQIDIKHTTPINKFGATKTEMNTNPIHNYFNHNLRFEHQADVYYLQDRDFLKNSPKIETPISVEDGLSI